MERSALNSFPVTAKLFVSLFCSSCMFWSLMSFDITRIVVRYWHALCVHCLFRHWIYWIHSSRTRRSRTRRRGSAAVCRHGMTSWIFTSHRKSNTSHTRYVPTAGVLNAVHVQGGSKTGLFFTVDNFAIFRNIGLGRIHGTGSLGHRVNGHLGFFTSRSMGHHFDPV